jgi:hypothetical protein
MQVTRSLDDFPLLFSLMRLVHSLLLNPHIHIEPYVSIYFIRWFAMSDLQSYFIALFVLLLGDPGIVHVLLEFRER